MPTLNALGNDGQVFNAVSLTRTYFSGLRDATSGVNATSTQTRSSKAVMLSRASTSVIITREFFAFDCSGISGTVTSATLKIHGFGSNSGVPIAIKASAPNSNGTTALAASDFQAIPGFSAGNTMNGNVTDYSAAFTGTWSVVGYNNFTLNSDARSDMQNNSIIQIAIVNYTYDYLNQSPGFSPSFANGLYYSDSSTASTRPVIDYVVATGPQVATVDNTAINDASGILGVAKANIASIDGIDLP